MKKKKKKKTKEKKENLKGQRRIEVQDHILREKEIEIDGKWFDW